MCPSDGGAGLFCGFEPGFPREGQARLTARAVVELQRADFLGPAGDPAGRGLDQADILLRLAESGVAIAILSSEAQEIIRLCDRALVMYHGEIMDEVRGERMNEHEIMRLATGG